MLDAGLVHVVDAIVEEASMVDPEANNDIGGTDELAGVQQVTVEEPIESNEGDQSGATAVGLAKVKTELPSLVAEAVVPTTVLGSVRVVLVPPKVSVAITLNLTKLAVC